MRKFNSILCIIIALSFLVSCSKDDPKDDSIVGTWQLTTWTIQVPIDLNNDNVANENLLVEAMCENNETLVFEANGTVSSLATYNPDVTVSLLDETNEVYAFTVICDTEGVIGISGSYSQNNNSVSLFNTTATINGNQLTVVYEDAIDIYNEQLTEVLATRDLTLVYTKK